LHPVRRDCCLDRISNTLGKAKALVVAPTNRVGGRVRLVAVAFARRSAVSKGKAITSVMLAFRAQSGTRGVARELHV
jgi:hypothetical protein